MSETKTLRELIERERIRVREAYMIVKAKGLGSILAMEAELELSRAEDATDAALADLEARAAVGDAVEAMPVYAYLHRTASDEFVYVVDSWERKPKGRGATAREALGMEPVVKP